MKNFTLLLLLILFGTPIGLFAQSDPYSHSTVFITPKIGATFSDADVSTLAKMGVGLDIGNTFFKYRAVEFDLRLGLLYGAWKGQNYRNTDLTGYETGVYSNSKSNYRDQLGYVVKNFKTYNFQASLEGVLRFNIIANGKYFPYVFGGIGAQAYNSSGDLLTNDGSIYLYEPGFVPKSRDYYEKLLDKKYETKLATSTAYSGNVGIGFGINITDGFRMGLEHKMTFLNKDNFDGDISNVKAYRQNDVYHFTSIYFQFYLRGRYYSRSNNNQQQHFPDPAPNPTPAPVPPVAPTPNNTNRVKNPPTIRYTRPGNPGSNVDGNRYNFSAVITNIENGNNLEVTYNGRSIRDFTFTAYNGVFTTSQVLIEGSNTITIRATNQDGQDTQSTYVIYQRKQQPPVVNFVNPSRNPYNTNISNFNIVAKVLYVSDRNSISFRQNGKSLYNFNFNTTNGDFSSNVNLVNGNNIFELSGTNQDGSDYATTVIVYENKVGCRTPIIVFDKQSSNSRLTSRTITGTAYNLSNRNQLTVYFNGRIINSYNYDVNTGKFTISVNLSPGNNLLKLVATNNCGSVQQEMTLNLPTPPTVVFSIPSQENTTVESNNFTFIANTSNINAKSQIQLNFNGVPISNYTFNSNTQQIQFPTLLTEGNNTVTIYVSNNDGSANVSTNVIYRARYIPKPPTTKWTNPSTDINTSFFNISLLAKTTNINDRDQITVTQNNSNLTNFIFDKSAQTVTLNSSLDEGNNQFLIIVMNNDGSSQDIVNINYKKKIVETIAPTVKWTTPVVDGSTSIVSRYQFVAKTTNVVSKNDISIQLNGRAISDFNYNSFDGKVSFIGALSNGNNTAKITVRRNNQQASDITTINLRGKITPNIPNIEIHCDKPVFNLGKTIVQNGGKTEIARMTLNGKIEKVASKSQIVVKFNGKIIDFNFTPSTGLFSSLVSNQNGNNIFTITMTNACGTTAYTYSYTYIEPQLITPEIHITSHTCPIQLYTGVNEISGYIKNISNQSQASFTLNGNNIQNITYGVSNGNITFTFIIEARAVTSTQTLIIKANNGKTVTKNCVVLPPSANRINNNQNGERQATDTNSQPTIKMPPVQRQNNSENERQRNGRGGVILQRRGR